MACTLTSGFALSNCNDSIGGIKTIWFAAATDLYADASTTISSTEITASTSTITFYKMSVHPEKASASTRAQASPDNGTVFYEQNLTVPVRDLDPTVQAIIEDIHKASLLLLIELNKGGYVLFGAENGCDSNGGGSEFGTQFGDMQMFEVVLLGRETKNMYLNMTAAAVDASSWTLTEP
jgi:hypothetical protein